MQSARSVDVVCFRFEGWDRAVLLLPNPAFKHKVLSICLQAIYTVYVHSFDKLFVSYRKATLGEPVSKQQLENWDVDLIAFSFHSRRIELG